MPFSNHEDYLHTKIFPSRPGVPPQNTVEKVLFRPPKVAKMDDKHECSSSSRHQYRTKAEDYGKGVFIAPLDYFWYGYDTLKCDGVLEMIDEKKIEQFHSAPNRVFPSDHLLMKAEFHFL